MARVTAAIPTHNRGALVVEAVESVLAQTYRDFELVVIDNGSTDDTSERLQPYLDRIRYVRQDNRGRAGSRNRALAEARGEYIAFLDSDDLWLPDRLERQVPVLEGSPEVALVHGHVEVIDAAGQLLEQETADHRKLWSSANRAPATYEGYAEECRCFTSTVLVRRRVLEELGGYDEEVGLEDLDLYLRIARRHEIAFLEGLPFARYRFHGAQTSNRELTLGHIDVCRKHLALIAGLPPTPALRKVERNLLLGLSHAHHLLLGRKQARRYALAAIRLDPGLLMHASLVRRLAVSLLPDQLVARARRTRASAT